MIPSAFAVPSLDELPVLRDVDLLSPLGALTLVGFSSTDELHNRIDELVASCMQQRGWTYEVVPRPETALDPLTVGQLEEFTAEYGYGY